MRKIFIDGKKLSEQAYFGWQDHVTALIGIKFGYKDSADKLVEIALNDGMKNRIKLLDTYVFPIVFSYRHAIEASLKLIYRRFCGKIPPGGHNLLTLWDNVVKDVISIFDTPEFITEVKKFKEEYRKHNVANINFDEIREMLKEFNSIDKHADVFRYLIDKNGELYFSNSKYIDYPNVKENMNYIYNILDYLFIVTDDYLTS